MRRVAPGTRGPLAILVLALCLGAGAGSGHAVDPRVLLVLGLILLAALLAGDLFERLGQPAVVGELLAGVVIGNVRLFTGWDGLDILASDPSFQLLAEIGVILLLFEVGLESDLNEMARVGITAALVAMVGVIAPVALGYGVHALLDPGASWHSHLFVGAILSATSVGITARVLKDLKKIDSPTGRVVLGAAVIDDVLGLIVLAVVAGIVSAANAGQPVALAEIAIVSGKAIGFLIGAALIGRPLSRLAFQAFRPVRSPGVTRVAALALCFVMAYAASAVGLHPIVGAFAAGVVLDAVAYSDLEAREPHGLEVQLRHIAAFLVPVFFVVTGARVQLGALADGRVLLLAGALTVAAVIGKQVCSLVASGPGVNRLAVGLGMIPRGEVGLIFASVGAALTLDGQPVVSPPIYAASVVMVMVTTMVTPPLLKWSLRETSSPSSRS
jgi:Kef-type K+ transport system membrane component KefB